MILVVVSLAAAVVVLCALFGSEPEPRSRRRAR